MTARVRDWFGWALVALGGCVLFRAVRSADARLVLEAGPLASSGFVLTLLGIHQLKVGAAAAVGHLAARTERAEPSPRANAIVSLAVAAGGIAAGLAAWWWGFWLLRQFVSLLGWTRG